MVLNSIPKKNDNTYRRQPKCTGFSYDEYFLAAAILFCLFLVFLFSFPIAVRVFQGMPISEIYCYTSRNLPADDKCCQKKKDAYKRANDSNAVIFERFIDCKCDR